MASFALQVRTGIVLWFELILSSFSVMEILFILNEEVRRMGFKPSVATYVLFLPIIFFLVMMTVVPCFFGLIGFHKSKPKYLRYYEQISSLYLGGWIGYMILLDVTGIVRKDLLKYLMTESLSKYEYLANRLRVYSHGTGDAYDLLLMEAILCFMNVFTSVLVFALLCAISIIHRYGKELEKEKMKRNPLLDIEMKV